MIYLSFLVASKNVFFLFRQRADLETLAKNICLSFHFACRKTLFLDSNRSWRESERKHQINKRRRKSKKKTINEIIIKNQYIFCYFIVNVKNAHWVFVTQNKIKTFHFFFFIKSSYWTKIQRKNTGFLMDTKKKKD